MRNLVIGTLFGLALVMPGPVEGAEGVYQLLIFDASLKQDINNDGHWEVCGDYLAAAETTSGKVIHFIYEKILSDQRSKAFAFSSIDRVVVSIQESAVTPKVAIRGEQWKLRFVLTMKAEDYKAALPCLANGTKI